MNNLSHKTCGQVANELSSAHIRYQQGQKTPADFQKDPKFVFLDLLTYGIDRGVSYPTGSQLALLTAGTIHKHQIRIDPELAQSKSTRQITLVVNKDNINEAAAIHFFHTLRTALENPSIILV
jgi:pyruvate/2-oxoglutarate dehydrogenase complex dihydrolipoamide acyltransferase (E2) component